ncbi:signal peptidase I [Vagococcus fluvialis]|jgi:signal peptidase I|uniref:signal peptidase I n=1 Tax=Vagococcus fluvialis TaxID=2738 RepID=UPI001A9078C9|nr:signal peptidase I [Vagococcus fluvialis]MBO0428408.1 signal peptidase I [Vagococcus fluvialis]MDR2277312.1 signal peptidase I [Vagococcus sp.]
MVENNTRRKKRKKKSSRSKSNSAKIELRSRKEIRKSGKQSSSKNVQNKKRGKKNSGFKQGKIIGAIGDIMFYLVVALIIGGAAFIYFGDQNATIMNHKIMTVLTESMKQTEGSGYDNGFNKGSMIVIKNQDPYTLEVGDIITFNPVRENKKVFLTHRVVEIDEEKKEKREAFITTKGDANNGTDVPIGASQVTGKVIKSIPNAGFVLSFLKQHIVVVAILISTLFGIIITLKYARTIE